MYQSLNKNRDSNYSITNNVSPWIGFNPSGQSNTQFHGYIDELAIWKRSLNKIEILQLYIYKLDSINSLYCEDDDLIHYYPMDDLIGDNNQYIEDVINGNNAYLGSSDETNTFDPQFSHGSPIIDICQIVKCPTQSPTNVPSLMPSRSPTNIPSKAPTRMPTQNPTSTPSLVPSYAPTPHPTPAPTSDPTPVPTDNPTTSPSNMPSFVPSNTPTGSPSHMPTKFPTFIPTFYPTHSQLFFIFWSKVVVHIELAVIL